MHSTPVFLATLIASILFLLVGVWILIFPPKTINSLYGYRTKNSMKSQSSWDFAQRFSGWEIIRWGILLFNCSLVGLQYNLDKNLELIIGLSMFVAVIIIFMVRTEQAIKKHILAEKQSQIN